MHPLLLGMVFLSGGALVRKFLLGVHAIVLFVLRGVIREEGAFLNQLLLFVVFYQYFQFPTKITKDKNRFGGI